MQRYEATTKYVGSGTYVGILVEDDTGEYVRHDDAQAEIARLRAALAKEREACDEWRSHWNRCGYSAMLAHDARVLDSIVSHDARRAAEAKE